MKFDGINIDAEKLTKEVLENKTEQKHAIDLLNYFIATADIISAIGPEFSSPSVEKVVFAGKIWTHEDFLILLYLAFEISKEFEAITLSCIEVYLSKHNETLKRILGVSV